MGLTYLPCQSLWQSRVKIQVTETVWHVGGRTAARRVTDSDVPSTPPTHTAAYTCGQSRRYYGSTVHDSTVTGEKEHLESTHYALNTLSLTLHVAHRAAF